ncbi:hypothetical protein GLOIN_2v1776801 [Rhizophagus clarus]|uniref:Transposase domain-containing protein n=1 Tax=Rhizophagus clarus TaxID=94130 RepID=A0A8H3QYS9_9GLOM|nr:hypothetical protein GLOIN_2v1776801 [Rhizophagus clarus]
MWDLLSVDDREILENFVRACFLLVYQIVSTNELNEAHSRLIKIGRLIEECYGKGLITLNIHLSLHLAECCYDYGLIYSFWCFLFERMNGILVRTNDQRLINGLKLIEPQKTIGSLAAYDDLESETLLQFKQIFCYKLEDTITGSKFYLGKFLNPIINCVELPENLYEHLITYYNEVYGDDMNVEFSSMSNLIDKAKFTQDNESVELYPGMVQFYFEHVLLLLNIALLILCQRSLISSRVLVFRTRS